MDSVMQRQRSHRMGVESMEYLVLLYYFWSVVERPSTCSLTIIYSTYNKIQQSNLAVGIRT